MPKKKLEWWQDVFDERYLKTYVDIITPEVTVKQVSFIHKNLGLKKGAKILDLACGHGRISIELAKLGYKVTGLDYSKHFIEIARKEAKEQDAQVEFIREDMRNLNSINKFDVILNIFTSFGYFKDENDDIKVIQKIARALRPGGKFLIDLNNIVRTISLMAKNGEVDKRGRLVNPGRKDKLSNGLIVKTQDIADAGTLRWSMIRTWKEKGKVRNYKTDSRLYTLPELKHLLEENGLKVQKVWGNYDGSRFSFASRRLVVLAKKR